MEQHVDYTRKGNNPAVRTDDDARIIGAEFDRLTVLMPHWQYRDILQEAKKPDNPLHRYVDWDDVAKAADNGWIGELRKLHSGYVRVWVKSDGEHLNVPAQVPVAWVDSPEEEDATPDTEVETHVAIAEVMNDAALQARAELSLFRRLNGARDQLALYPRFAGIVREMDKVAAQYMREQEQADSFVQAEQLKLASG